MSKVTQLGAGLLSTAIGAILTAISITAMRANVPEWELLGAIGFSMGVLLFLGGLLYKYTLMAWVVSAVNGALLTICLIYGRGGPSQRPVNWERIFQRPEAFFFIASIVLEVFALARVINGNPKLAEK